MNKQLQMFSITCKYVFLEKLDREKKEKQKQFDKNNDPNNYWSARKGNSQLRQLEQFFSIILIEFADIFEAIDIYTRLRNDQYVSLDDMLQSQPKFGGQILYFLRILIDQSLTRNKPFDKDQLQTALNLCSTIKKFEKSVQFLNK